MKDLLSTVPQYGEENHALFRTISTMYVQIWIILKIKRKNYNSVE